MRENTKRSKLILDTNVLFSAIRYRGKPFELLEEAEKEDVEIMIPEYVLDELKEIFERKDIDFSLVEHFLSTYSNIKIVKRDFSEDLIDLAKEKVTDRKDRPIFIYTLILRQEYPYTYLVTGDKSLMTSLNKVEKNSAITVDEALKMIRGEIT